VSKGWTPGLRWGTHQDNKDDEKRARDASQKKGGMKKKKKGVALGLKGILEM
jgi:hypothetical protein